MMGNPPPLAEIENGGFMIWPEAGSLQTSHFSGLVLSNKAGCLLIVSIQWSN